MLGNLVKKYHKAVDTLAEVVWVAILSVNVVAQYIKEAK